MPLALSKLEMIMASMNVSLPDPMRDWVQSRIDSGRYASVSDYVRDLIRRDQDTADQRQALVAALIEGERSGVSERRVGDILAAIRKEANHSVLYRKVPPGVPIVRVLHQRMEPGRHLD